MGSRFQRGVGQSTRPVDAGSSVGSSAIPKGIPANDPQWCPKRRLSCVLHTCQGQTEVQVTQ